MINPDFELRILTSDEVDSLALSILDAFHGVPVSQAKATLKILDQLIEMNTIIAAKSLELNAARTAFEEFFISKNEQA